MAVPDQVRMTSIFSRTDGVVRWLSCVADYATCVEVPGSHLGMMCNRHTYRAVAHALAEPSSGDSSDSQINPRHNRKEKQWPRCYFEVMK